MSKNASDKPLLVSNLTNLMNCGSRLRRHHSHLQNIAGKSYTDLRKDDRACPPGGVVLQFEPHVLTALAGLLNSMVTPSVDNVNGHQCVVSGSLNPHFIWSFFQFQVSTFLSDALLIVLARILLTEIVLRLQFCVCHRIKPVCHEKIFEFLLKVVYWIIS